MPLLKRPAAAAVASEPKPKQQKLQKKQEQEEQDKFKDPFIRKCNAIISVLMESDGFSEVTRHMLASSVKGCFTTSKEERHAVQNAVIDMISEVLSGVEARHEEKLATIQAKIADADAEKQRREAAAQAAANAEMEKTEAVKTAEAQLEQAKVASTTAWSAVGAASSAQREGDADLVKAEDKKAIAEATLSNVFVPLREGSADKLDECIESLSKATTYLGLEEQLISTAAVVLRKPASERAAFDSVVVQQIDEQLTTVISTLTVQLANGEAGKHERAAKVQACQSKAEAAEKHVEACSETLNVAKATLDEAEAARKVADMSVQDMGPEMEAAAASAAGAEAVLVASRADMDTFKELVEGKPAAPEPKSAEASQLEASAEQA